MADMRVSRWPTRPTETQPSEAAASELLTAKRATSRPYGRISALRCCLKSQPAALIVLQLTDALTNARDHFPGLCIATVSRAVMRTRDTMGCVRFAWRCPPSTGLGAGASGIPAYRPVRWSEL
jgi:hypothetical protein